MIDLPSLPFLVFQILLLDLEVLRSFFHLLLNFLAPFSQFSLSLLPFISSPFFTYFPESITWFLLGVDCGTPPAVYLRTLFPKITSMAPRLTESGKRIQLLDEGNEQRIRRIKAPNLDTSALVKQNELSLIGRLTNPREQKMGALLPALPRRWNLTGRVTGSDLGNDCFLFRFEKEEDLRRVLDNRPYHFAYWMVIIQRWEPVISATFPSMIPFWITIRGIPLHYWHEDVVVSIGRDLGTLMNHELSSTTARVKVLIDGLKPVVKKSFLDFDSGEESLITFEYEKLELHCSLCNSLCHAGKFCPERFEDYPSNALTRYSRETEDWSSPVLPRSNREPPPRDRVSSRQTLDSQTVNKPLSREEKGKAKKIEPYTAFHQRVDRHGNPFGARTSTKQTRTAPPEAAVAAQVKTSLPWRQEETREASPRHASPPYSRVRPYNKAPSSKGRDLFPPQSKTEWRPKLVRAPEEFQPRRPSPDTAPQSVEPRPLRPVLVEEPSEVLPTRENVLEVLHEATRLYLSHPDPVEAAARRQRVHYGDASGQTEEAADAMLAAAEERASRNARASAQLTMLDENPVTPPPLNALPQAAWMIPETTATSSPPHNADLIHGMASLNRMEEERNLVCDPVESTVRGRGDGQKKLRSIIISPSRENTPISPVVGTPVHQLDENETLSEFQTKVRRKNTRISHRKSPRNSPSILRGTSSKKRNLSQIQNSPRPRAASPSMKSSRSYKKQKKGSNGAETSNNPMNPPIKLIPAMTRKKSDFRSLPPPAP